MNQVGPPQHQPRTVYNAGVSPGDGQPETGPLAHLVAHRLGLRVFRQRRSLSVSVDPVPMLNFEQQAQQRK